MQIVKKYNKEIVSKIAFKCSDAGFNDFEKTDYGQIVFETERMIAREYRILERKIIFTIESVDVDNEIVLHIDNFIAEFSVKVNSVWMNNKLELENWLDYRIYYNTNNTLVIDYYGKAINDEVEIRYTVSGDTTEEYDGNPITPDKYIEELERRSIIGMAELGMVKYTGNQKETKYRKIYDLYRNKDKVDTRSLSRNDEWPSIRIYNGLGDQ